MTLCTEEVGKSLELPAWVSLSSDDTASLKAHQSGLLAGAQEGLLKDSHEEQTIQLQEEKLL